jgi:hypothetical protein
MLDFNATATRRSAFSNAVNAVVDSTMTALGAVTVGRDYLGASSLGHDCLRRIQWDWRHPVQPEPRIERIFARGRWWEKYCAWLLTEAGFTIVRSGPALEFAQLDDQFKGHADALIVAGPDCLPYPCLWECKGLGSTGWKKLAKEGLARAYPAYADQVALYQAYLDLTAHPALFTAANMDTMQVLHLAVPFDPERAQAASDRAVQIVNAVAAGETLPRIAAEPDDWRCKLCPHKERCWGMMLLPASKYLPTAGRR